MQDQNLTVAYCVCEETYDVVSNKILAKKPVLKEN